MAKLIQKVHGHFEEEKLMHESPDSEYYDKLRKCHKYHYTDEEGLKGILTNRTLWLMDSIGLSDDSEGKLILQKAKNKLRAIDIELLSRFEKEITPQLEHFYSCSFSSYGNLLSQWRGYGDNIAVGFDWNLLGSQNPRMIIDHSGEHSTTSGLDFVQCQYIDPSDEPASEPFVKTVVSAFLDTFNNRKPELHEIQYYALKIGAITTSVKHIGFFEEREYRVVHYFWDAKGIHDLNTNKIEYRFQECCVKSKSFPNV